MTVTIATLVAFCLALPLAVLSVECWLSLLPLRRHNVNSPSAPIRVAVVVPAHNEEHCIAAAVTCIQNQVEDGANVIVIADNCDDATAERASAAGAIVWQRVDATHRGKGYTLNFAVERLSESPPDVVVFIDADCIAGPDCIETLTRLASQHQRPVQAAYMMRAPESGEDLTSVSALAVYVKNIVRPRGLQRLGLPCMLTGSGMAFPWRVLSAVRFPDEHIAEDTRITTDLVVAGFAPIPCMDVYVSSALPAHRAGFMSQRTRWEHGHLSTILFEAPRLLVALFKRPSLRVLSVLLELSVPPLSLMVVIAVFSALVLAGVSYGIGAWLPLLSYLAIALTAAAGGIAVWLRDGRDILSPRTALRIPKYALVKAPMYLRFVTHRQRTWIRTERSAPTADNLAVHRPPRVHSATLSPSAGTDEPS